jgi:hypothetical protein
VLLKDGQYSIEALHISEDCVQYGIGVVAFSAHGRGEEGLCVLSKVSCHGSFEQWGRNREDPVLCVTNFLAQSTELAGLY